MLYSGVIKFILVHLTIHCTQSKVQDYSYAPNRLETYGKHSIALGNDSEVYNKTSRVSESPSDSYKIHMPPDLHEQKSQFIRSDVTLALNGTGVERPDARLVRNKEIPPEVINQIHTFFADKAREDAYQRTEAEEHPYSVSYLFYNRRGDLMGMCSGTLVTNSWVVTAAHCLVDKPVLSVKVFGGVTFNVFRPPKNLPKRSQVRTSFEFFTHPRYDPYSDDADYDVGLIKISPPFYSNNFLSPIPMTSKPWTFDGYRKCILTAFGAVRDERSSPDDYIRKTQYLWMQKPCECSGHLMGQLGTGPVRRYVCMKPMRDFGICAGDSGGGLICDGELKAVASFSYKIDNLAKCQLRGLSGSGECGDIDQFSVMQDLHPSLSWIRKNAFHMNATNKDANGAIVQRQCTLTLVLSFVLLILGNTRTRNRPW